MAKSKTLPALAAKPGIRACIYIASIAAQRLFNFALAPYFVATMPPAEFTRYGLLTTLLSLVPALISLRVHTAPVRLMFDYRDQRSRQECAATSLLGGVGLAIVLGFVVAAGLAAFAVSDPVTQGHVGLWLIILALSVMRIVGECCAFLAKAVGAAGGVFWIAVSEGLVTSISCVAGFSLGFPKFEAVLYSFLLGSTVSALCGIVIVRSHLFPLVFKRAMFVASLRYAAPTAVHLVAFWVTSQIGRWIGSTRFGMKEMAGYSLLVLVITIGGVFCRAIYDARRPEVGEALAQGNTKAAVGLLRGAFRIGLAGLLAGYIAYAGLMSMFRSEIDRHYFVTTPMMFVAFAASLLDLWNCNGTTLLLSLKRSGVQAVISSGAAVGTILLTWFWPVHDGPLGLFCAFVVGSMIQAAGLFFVGRRVTESLVPRLATVT